MSEACKDIRLRLWVAEEIGLQPAYPMATSTGIGNGIAKELDLFRLGPGLARNAKLGHWSRSSDLAKKISTVCGRHMHMGRRLRTYGCAGFHKPSEVDRCGLLSPPTRPALRWLGCAGAGTLQHRKCHCNCSQLPSRQKLERDRSGQSWD